MKDQQYSVGQEKISTLLNWVDTNKIAIPEIQRPFVWKTTKVRDLIDSLYKSYPVGYIIVWKDPNVRLKDGSSSNGKEVIIDGQQRITSLSAALMGKEVMTQEYSKTRIRIAFNPSTEEFETLTPAIEKNTLWIPDISILFTGAKSSLSLHREYMEINKDKNLEEEVVYKAINDLENIKNNQIGVVSLGETDTEIVAEIFNRINSKGQALGEYDFVMSKIASKEQYNGVNLRKIIEYFCHLSERPQDFDTIKNNDKEFSNSEYLDRIKWAKDAKFDVCQFDYKDIIKIAFTYKFQRGKLKDLVALLSGRNFEKRIFEEEISAQSFSTFQSAVEDVCKKTYFERFAMMIRSLGFIAKELIPSSSSINFAYALYLYLKNNTKTEDVIIEKIVQKWFVFSILTERYSSSTETRYDEDIRNIRDDGAEKTLDGLIKSNIYDGFWELSLTKKLEANVASNPYARLYVATLCKEREKGFLSKNIAVYDMIINRGDIHHIYPRDYLKKNGLDRSLYNQVANYVYCETPINIKIGASSPKEYIAEVLETLGTEAARLSGINTKDDLLENLKQCDIPEIAIEGTIDNYKDFLEKRRYLMAQRIKRYWETL